MESRAQDAADDVGNFLQGDGTTFGGTPLACAAALAVLDVIEKEQLLAHVTKLSAAWHEALGQLAKNFPQHIAAVRGKGFLVGVQMTGDTTPYLTAMRERGLLADANVVTGYAGVLRRASSKVAA